MLYNNFGYNTRACGVHDYALVQFDEVLATWADEIVVVEEYLSKHIPDVFKEKLIILSIPDSFEYMNEELQKICLDQYKEKH